MRVVSLVPSLTESLLAWRVTPVACTRFCEQPTLLHVGGTKDPDLDAIEALHPDLVLLCEEENRREDYDALLARGLRCHTVRIDDVDDVAPALVALADALGVSFDVSTAHLPAPIEPSGRRVFLPIWRRPWMTVSGGTYGASMLRRLGFDTLFADHDVRYPSITVEDVAALQPDLIVLPTEPYPFKDRHRAEWSDVAPAVIVDGQDLFWWGTRTPAALTRLAAQLA